jgi:hypothetical protein
MDRPCEISGNDFELSFKVFHQLMARKVHEILLVSSAYDAFIMEEDGRLAERIIHEYRGLNLSSPPMLTWVSDSHEALETLSKKDFDLVISMPRLDDIEPLEFGPNRLNSDEKSKKNIPKPPFFFWFTAPAGCFLIQNTPIGAL